MESEGRSSGSQHFVKTTSFRIATTQRPDGRWALKVLGVGTFSNVYEAVTDGFGPSSVAIKIARPDPRARLGHERSSREGAVLDRLQGHPGIVRAYGMEPALPPLGLSESDGALVTLGCPKCNEPLAFAPDRKARCAAGHGFDLANDGEREKVAQAAGLPGPVSVPLTVPSEAIVLERLGASLESWTVGEVGHAFDSQEEAYVALLFRLQVVDQIAGAVAWIHERGLAHLDLNPSSVLFEAGSPTSPQEDRMPPRIRLVDFDQAVDIDDPPPPTARQGSASVSRTWSAPEVAEPVDAFLRATLDAEGSTVTLTSADDLARVAVDDYLVDGYGRGWRLKCPTDDPHEWVVEPVAEADGAATEGPFDIYRNAGPAADVYSLGALLYFAMTGHQAQVSQLGLAARIVEETEIAAGANRPSRVVAALPESLRRTLLEPLRWTGGFAEDVLGLALLCQARKAGVAFCASRSDPLATGSAAQLQAGIRELLTHIRTALRGAAPPPPPTEPLMPRVAPAEAASLADMDVPGDSAVDAFFHPPPPARSPMPIGLIVAAAVVAFALGWFFASRGTKPAEPPPKAPAGKAQGALTAPTPGVSARPAEGPPRSLTRSLPEAVRPPAPGRIVSAPGPVRRVAAPPAPAAAPPRPAETTAVSVVATSASPAGGAGSAAAGAASSESPTDALVSYGHRALQAGRFRLAVHYYQRARRLGAGPEVDGYIARARRAGDAAAR